MRNAEELKAAPPILRITHHELHERHVPMSTVADITRCWWAGSDPLMVTYHDEEWGVPCHDERELFKRLMLECFQAGLSWSTILRKREHFSRAFEGWDPVVVAGYGEPEFERLMDDP